MYGNNFSPNRFGHSPQFSPNEQRYRSPMSGPPRFQHQHGDGYDGGSPSPQFRPRFMGPPPDRGCQNFRGRSPQYHHQRRGFNSPPYDSSTPSRPSPHNQSHGSNDGWGNNSRGRQKSHYGGGRGRGRHMGYSYNCHSNPGYSNRIEDYFSPDMLQDPWAEFAQKPSSPKREESRLLSPPHQPPASTSPE